jgi:Transposase DDE domain/Domain of unknown function (DUF4372)
MAHFNTVLAQLQHFLPLQEFDSFVRQHEADKWTKHFTTKNQLTVMLYAQAKGKESLRDIEQGLKVRDSIFYHLGLANVSRSTLSRVNESRPYDIYESLFYELLRKCQSLTSRAVSQFTFKNDLYALDATVIELCLNLFPWATFRKEKGAIKLHTLFNVRSQIPELIIESDGKVTDIEMARHVDLGKLVRGSIIVMDRGYIDYSWLFDIHQHHHFFVTRIKVNAQIIPLEDCPVTEKGILKDQKIGFALPDSLEAYPEGLRLIKYHDEKTRKTYEFITNNFELSARTIADIYKSRWQVELFFKWIKQHLKIKTFFGTSKNAVMTQIWIAMIYYLLLAWIKYQTKFKGSLLELSRMISEVLLHPVPLINIIRLTPRSVTRALARAAPDQLPLF